MDADRAARQRSEMVEHQLRNRGISDPLVLDAMGRLPREHFMPSDLADQAYADAALPIEAGQTISQPFMVAVMTELLRPHPGMRVLEIGTGSGYQAAILAAIGCRVLTIERERDLAASAAARLADPALDAIRPGLAGMIRIEVGDGTLGWPPEAPFEGILVTAAAPHVPEPLRAQVADEGRLVIPLGSLDGQELVRLVRHGSQFEEGRFGGCVFVPLIGAEAWDEGAFDRIRKRGFGRFWL